MSRDRSAWFYIFVLMFVLILVSYYVGTKSDVNALSSAAVNIGYMLTGRNAHGATGNYASGATAS